jgi:hypothetical protein
MQPDPVMTHAMHKETLVREATHEISKKDLGTTYSLGQGEQYTTMSGNVNRMTNVRIPKMMHQATIPNFDHHAGPSDPLQYAQAMARPNHDWHGKTVATAANKQVYKEFITSDGYVAPAGIFHTPDLLGIPGMKFEEQGQLQAYYQGHPGGRFGASDAAKAEMRHAYQNDGQHRFGFAGHDGVHTTALNLVGMKKDEIAFGDKRDKPLGPDDSASQMGSPRWNGQQATDAAQFKLRAGPMMYGMTGVSAPAPGAAPMAAPMMQTSMAPPAGLSFPGMGLKPPQMGFGGLNRQPMAPMSVGLSMSKPAAAAAQQDGQVYVYDKDGNLVPKTA